VQGAILAAELVFNDRAGDLWTEERRVFEQLGPGEGVDDAEILGEAMLDRLLTASWL